MISVLRPTGDAERSLALRAVGITVALRVLAVAVFVIAAGGFRAVHERLTRWDANWYAGVAANGYGFTKALPDERHLSDEAFFPLYPVLERVGHTITGLTYKDAGLVVSAVSLVAAAWGIYAVGVSIAEPRTALWLTGLWAALPTTIVLTLAYSEALFIALAAWSLHAVLRRRWLVAAGLAALAGLTRPTGVAVAAAVVVAAAVEVVRLRRERSPSAELRQPVAAVIAAPLGWVGYLVYVGGRHDDPLRYFAVQNGWGNGFDGGGAFAEWIGRHLADVGHPAQAAAGLGLLVGIVALLGLFAMLVRDRVPLPVLVYTGVLLIFVLTTSRYFGSKPRYLLPAFSLLLPIAARLARWRPSRHVVKPLVLGPVVVASAAGGAFTLLGSGPP